MLERLRMLRPVATRGLMTGILATAVAMPGSGAPAAAAQLPPYEVIPGVVLHPKPPRFGLPVTSYRLTGRFGDVSSLWASRHTGLDFAAPSGTPIHAVGAGVVVSTGYDGRYGNKTVIRLADGTEVWYCHQSAFAVHVGQRIRVGELIGSIGSTGNVTGPHLHLEIHPGGGDPVDPEPWLRARGLRP